MVVAVKGRVRKSPSNGMSDHVVIDSIMSADTIKSNAFILTRFAVGSENVAQGRRGESLGHIYWWNNWYD